VKYFKMVDNKKKILVTGGNGFIGSNLIKRLVSDGYSVVSLDDLSTGLVENEIDGCNYWYGDIEQLLYWKGDNFDLCFHLAALSRVQTSFDDPLDTFRVNGNGTEIVAEWARQNNVKVVYAGSASKWTDYTQSPYASTKKIGEDIIKMYKNSYGCNFEIARFYNVYGPNEFVHPTMASVIGIWRYQIENGIPITIVGDGNQTRDFVHVDDIVDGLVKIAFSSEQHSDAWELGSGNTYSVNQLFEMFKSRFNHIEKIHIPNQKGNSLNSNRINDDAIKILKWNPSDKLENYIKSL
jgi:UDP-glucose 4-epimerase